MKHWLILLFTLLGLQSAAVNATNAFDHSAWDALLNQHVYLLRDGQASQVDYQGFADNQPKLAAYLQQLSQVSVLEFDSWPKPDQLAFLINAYNAWTVDLILQKWPDLESIKDLGSLFRSPWGKAFIPLLGETRSLDDIEHKLIRGSDRYQDPRIHFAVNCASVGCPALANRAYQGDNLEALLESQTRLFLADRSRNRFNNDHLEISSIFKWYRKDFEKGWRGYFSLPDFLLHYAADLSLSTDVMKTLQAKPPDIEFLDYNWALNAKP
ncbi:DUF547 domain-containing protein [Marinomonas transparens]|uniref:DUF547 domain-containing protein n=1 Tax=Marinomonas transparens TaxID=2795388 RepID=A0A934MY98_9GAMM|nr:DUF547 domain-containing protein [Marinomonas transparens]MBJ7536230.1 DUF547 domain-containing protein [Marinomonas transparens]